MLFAPEPKQFLVDSLDQYRKPVLVRSDDVHDREPVEFANIKHGEFYQLTFMKAERF